MLPPCEKQKVGPSAENETKNGRENEEWIKSVGADLTGYMLTSKVLRPQQRHLQTHDPNPNHWRRKIEAARHHSPRPGSTNH
ncbi:hypothetical protein T265_08939 [Opisthorchis viverrini]|uniref:Uncharacterized protein n=1 Tax=Opisthorchis viverrini TaxID=6198 RepID=A0A074Z7J4_OPIVI|nr:hypothetical protein T265_08939 [Opisthorchis viverrini]KER23083.1 hypothetical protein T265_08939 [Opisthorchis viverrini]